MTENEWKAVLEVLELWSPLGEQLAGTGARLIGHVPHVAPLAYFHEIYPGLTEKEFAELEARVGRRIPESYGSFLRLSNGANLFSDALSLDGLRNSYARTPDASRLPYALETANTHERPQGAPEDAVFIGSYNFDGSRLWLRPGDPSIHRCGQYEWAPTLNTWPSFATMLKNEVERLRALFDDKGVLLDEEAVTTPPADEH